MLDFLSDLCEILWAIIVNMHLWLILSAIVTVMALKEGLVEIAVGFAGVFFLILMFGWDKIFGEYVMVHGMIAIFIGLCIAFFIWIARN